MERGGCQLGRTTINVVLGSPEYLHQVKPFVNGHDKIGINGHEKPAQMVIKKGK